MRRNIRAHRPRRDFNGGWPSRGLFLLLLCLLALPLLSGRARAAEAVASGSCGDSLTWTLDSEGVLTISGTGEMWDYFAPIDDFWKPYSDQLKTLVIQEGVTSIGSCAFRNCSSLTGSLVIPGSVRTIGSSAFASCKNLDALLLPEGVVSIGTNAFLGCTGLTGDLILPDSITAIGEGAFSGCRGLNGRLELPAYIKSIEDKVFSECTGLTGPLIIPDGVTEIGNSAFYNCYHLTGPLTIPDGVTEIGHSAFYWCSGLTGPLTIPDGVTKIGNSAFYRCDGLTGDLIIPDSVTEIDFSAFHGCSGLDGTLKLPAGITQIQVCAFRDCSALTGNLSIPESVTEIGGEAFCGCSGLTGTLTIPAGVTKIGDGAFEGCVGLTGDLIIPDSVTEIGPYAFYNCIGLTGTLRIPDNLKEIGEGVFRGCVGLTGDLIIPDSVTSIGEAAFSYCSGFTGKLELPEHLTEIGPSAFSDCTGFTGTLDIPSGVAYIGPYAFAECSNLANVRFEGDAFTPASKYMFPEGITLYVPPDASGWTVPEWNGYHTAWYIPPETVTLGAAGSKIYIPTGATTSAAADPNRVKRTPISFWAGLAQEGYQEVPMEIPWGWELFQQDTPHYDNRLAIAALALSSAIEGGPDRIAALLDDLGFEKLHYYEYDTWVTREVTHAIAARRVQLDGEDCDIFAVVSRGTSNVSDMITDLIAGGFHQAAEHTWENLQQYLLDYYGETELSALKGKNMKFLVTGHSLGGAVANLMPWKMEDFAPEEDVLVYTFAAPFTWGSYWGRRNVYNVVNEEDVVPQLSPAADSYRIGTSYSFHRKDINQMNTAFLLLVNGGQTGAPSLDHVLDAAIFGLHTYDLFTRIGYSHSTVTYMAYLLTRSDADELWSYGIRKAAIRCPVDVEVYNGAGILVGRVADGQVDETVRQDVLIQVIGDEKYVYLPADEEYTLVLTGNDAGVMRYTVTEIDPATGEVTEKEFSAVALEAGKTMTSEGAGGIPVPDVQLFVVDGASAPSAEVSVSGQEVETSGPIPVAAITGIPRHMVKGSSVTLAGVIRPSYAGEREILWALADPGTTGAALKGNVLTAPSAGTLTLTATVPDGLAAGVDFVRSFPVAVTEPPALPAPSLLEWDGRTATWNFVDDALAFRVQLYRDGTPSGTPVETTALDWDFSEQMEDADAADYTFTVTTLGDGTAFGDSAPSESSAPYRPVRAALTSVSGGRVSVQVQIDGDRGEIAVAAARYEGGRMTAACVRLITASGTVEADLSGGSGEIYRVFLLEAGTWAPLCERAEY